MIAQTHSCGLRFRRRGLLVGLVVLSGVSVGACGAGSPGNGGTSTKVASTSSGSRARPSSRSRPTHGAGTGPLAFSKCMRSSGVPNFPDPQAGRGELFDVSGLDTSSPAFRAAQAKCRALLGGGPPVPGTTTNPSPRTLSKLVRIARCMRQHGISQFPDPRTSVPANLNPAVDPQVTDFDGAILLFPATLNLQAPAYRRDLSACGAPPLGLPH